MKWQTLIVLCCVVLSTADDYENKLTKLWSLSSANDVDGSSVVNVTSASIVIQPSSYADASSKALPYARYAFKPRAIPLRREQPRIEKNRYYTQDEAKYTPHVLFRGNFNAISKEKSNATDGRRARQARQFIPMTIPLIRNDDFQKRALEVDEEPIIEKPEGFTEQTASRRSISDMFSVNDEDEEDDDDLEGEYETEDLDDSRKKNKIKRKRKNKLKSHKIKQYMLPLLMAYKMKFVALAPVMIAGLILLVGATGLSGFFFALFAAAMALQKGSTY